MKNYLLFNKTDTVILGIRIVKIELKNLFTFDLKAKI